MLADALVTLAADDNSRFRRPVLERSRPLRSYRYLFHPPWGRWRDPAGWERTSSIKTARGRRNAVVEALRYADRICRENVNDGDGAPRWERSSPRPSLGALGEMGANVCQNIVDLGYQYWSESAPCSGNRRVVGERAATARAAAATSCRASAGATGVVPNASTASAIGSTRPGSEPSRSLVGPRRTARCGERPG